MCQTCSGITLDILFQFWLQFDLLEFRQVFYYSQAALVIGLSEILCHCVIAVSADVSCVDMRRDIQEIFRATPHSKQVMMFSATLSRDIRPVCKKFMQDVIILLG